MFVSLIRRVLLLKKNMLAMVPELIRLLIVLARKLLFSITGTMKRSTPYPQRYGIFIFKRLILLGN